MTTASQRAREAHPGTDTGRPAGREELPGQDRVLGSLYPPGLTFAGPGDVHVIQVAGIGVVQDKDFDTGTPLYWPSGQPRDVMVVHGPADDGPSGSWWVRGRRATTALRDACKAARITGLAVGDLVAITRGPDEEVPPPNGRGKSTWANTWDVVVTPAGDK